MKGWMNTNPPWSVSSPSMAMAVIAALGVATYDLLRNYRTIQFGQKQPETVHLISCQFSQKSE